jgi:putative ABC transport system permease protein
MKGERRNMPPIWATRFLYWFCKDDLIEEIEGDILEEFNEKIDSKNKYKADWFYIISVISFFRPFAIRNFNWSTQNDRMMFYNYFKVAFRSLKKDKINTLISTFGLFLAIVSSMVIYVIIRYETGYDVFHQKADNIYRVIIEVSKKDTRSHSATVGPPLGPAFSAFYPEVKNAVRFRYSPTRIMATENHQKQFYEEKIFYVDPSVFQVFSYPLLEGDPHSALKEKNEIVLTYEMAEKYFEDKDPLGEILLLDNETPYVVSGVLAPIPTNTHFRFDFLIPFEAFEVPFGYPVTLDDFGWTSFHTYVLLQDGVDYRELEEKLPEFAKTHFNEDQLSRFTYHLQPLKNIYFDPIYHEDIASGNESNVVILGSIGILLILLATFNFTNISTARSLTRATETGLRKTLGSSKKSLVLRYLAEPILIVFSTLLLALLLTPYLVNEVNVLFGLLINWKYDLWIEVIPVFLSIAVLIGFLSGLYPAFIMSSFKPVSMIRGSHLRISGGINLRKILVTLQFIITSFLLIGSFIISSQIDFMKNQDLGFAKEEILLIRMPGEELNEQYQKIRSALFQNPRISSVSVGGGRLDVETGNDAVREDYYRTIGTKIIAGREFLFAHPSDSVEGIIINREAARYFGWEPEEALGRHLSVGQIMSGKVIGVVENYHIASLHTRINPLVVYYPRTLLQDIFIRVTAGEIKPLISSIQKEWESLLPDIPFDFTFLDQHLNKLYERDIQFAWMVKIFSLITILIAILGLYGLISIAFEQRIKEISIRKVLGASFESLIMTLSKSFFVMILIANIIAWPLVYVVSENWLNEFAYHTTIKFTWFILILLFTCFVAVITLIFRAGKVIRLNPVVTLKYE